MIAILKKHNQTVSIFNYTQGLIYSFASALLTPVHLSYTSEQLKSLPETHTGLLSALLKLSCLN